MVIKPILNSFAYWTLAYRFFFSHLFIYHNVTLTNLKSCPVSKNLYWDTKHETIFSGHKLGFWEKRVSIEKRSERETSKLVVCAGAHTLRSRSTSTAVVYVWTYRDCASAQQRHALTVIYFHHNDATAYFMHSTQQPNQFIT